ncbi:hypothetical protein JVU11DRAFT_45 [Chiua virens]|nr:hypothetical protein JVU11DRAFT_45 [Chiua virens]
MSSAGKIPDSSSHHWVLLRRNRVCTTDHRQLRTNSDARNLLRKDVPSMRRPERSRAWKDYSIQTSENSFWTSPMETTLSAWCKPFFLKPPKIDIVVNNAGASAAGPIAEVTIEQMRHAFELNTFGALRVSNAVIPSMFKRKEGLIVNIGSIGGNITTPWNTLYSAAKAALHTISEGLAMECKPFGVKVMLVVPGMVTSNIAKNQAVTFALSATTMFRDYESKMSRWTQQRSGCMDPSEFARKVVTFDVECNPPAVHDAGWRLHLVLFPSTSTQTVRPSHDVQKFNRLLVPAAMVHSSIGSSSAVYV